MKRGGGWNVDDYPDWGSLKEAFIMLSELYEAQKRIISNLSEENTALKEEIRQLQIDAENNMSAFNSHANRDNNF